jgi:hypothetical protein
LRTDPARFFSSWRTVSLTGSREVWDGVVVAAHQTPSPELAAFLREWPGAWYWASDDHTRLILIQGTAPARPERWLWHGALLVLFVICTLAAGEIVAGHLRPPIYSGLGGAVTGGLEFGEYLIAGGWRALPSGWAFALPLLGILLVHELGHYFVARRYAIDVSPPYFIPVPPNLSPIGGLGAFIRLRSAVYDRRQLLDVGAAGPLLGFLVALVVLFWGYQLSHRVGAPIAGAPSFVLFAGRPILLGESLISHFMREWLVQGQGPVRLAPEAFAGWVGMFITGVNLLPLSQLDGGHVLYGLVGKHQRTVAIVVALGLVVLGTRAPMWYLWAGLTLAIGGGRWGHAAVVIPSRPVNLRGRWVGAACVVVFVLTFVPIPFGT